MRASITIAAAFLSLSLPSIVTAQEAGGKVRDQAKEQVDCSVLADVAKGMMDARQSGVNKDTQLAFAQAAEPPFREMVLSIVSMAYERPLHQAKQMQQREVEDFRDMIERRCNQTD